MKCEKYAFIVGNGDLVKTVIAKAKEKKINFIIGGIKGLSDKKLVRSHNNFWFYIGEIGFLFYKLRREKITKVILLGSIKRPSLFSLRVDELGKKILKRYLNKVSGDDSLLKIVIKNFENQNFQIVGFQDIDDSLLSKKGLLTKISPDEKAKKEIEKAIEIAKKLSHFDIGQSIIFQQNMVIAVEGAEGTANMILRSKKIVKKEGDKAFLVKIKKLSQDIRVDLPTIGDKTIIQAKKANLSGIVIESKYTVILNYKKTIDLANKYNMFIIAI